MGGLALRQRNDVSMELNLCSASVVAQAGTRKSGDHFTVAAACFLVALIGWSAYYTRAAR